MRNRLPTAKTALAILSFVYCMQSTALDIDSSSLRLNGFGTFGLTKADNQYLGSRNNVSQEGVFDEDWSPELSSKLGLQADYSLSDTVRLGAQLLFQSRPDNSFDKTLHWAYIGVDLTPSTELRIGRMAKEIYMLSDYRKVSFAQLWAHPPTEFYAHINNDIADGLSLAHKTNLFDGVMSTRLFVARSDYEYYSGDTFKADYKASYSFTANWENQVWQLRATYSQGDIREQQSDFDAFYDNLRLLQNFGWTDAESIANKMDGDKYRTRYFVLGASYNKRNWVIQTEISRIDSDLAVTNNYDTGYISLGKRFNNFTPYIVVAQSKNDRLIIPAAPPAFFEPQLISQLIANQYYSSQQTISLGLRWNISQRIALKSEWDRTNVDPYGGFLFEQPEAQSNKQTVNRYSLSLDFIF